MIPAVKPQPKIILEGTHLTGKTDLAFVLAEHPRIIGERRHRWHIPLVSSEWETFADEQPTREAPGHSMIDFQPHQEALAMETFHTYTRLFELQRDFYWIVDRFHISAAAYQLTQQGKLLDFSWLEDRLAALDFRLVLCTRRPETFEEARRERVAYSEHPWRYDNLDLFIEEQEVMREFFEKSPLKKLEIDVSANSEKDAATRVLDWVESTDGFWHKAA
jgi:thymidylate kinase